MLTYDCVIIGSGIAALQLAHHLRDDYSVLIVTKGHRTTSNSYRAQGGIASSMAENDHWLLHYKDTLNAGCHFHNEQAVKELVQAGPQHMSDLISSGVDFDRDEKGQLYLGMEGAHSRHRIVHCGGDATGKHVMDHLLSTCPQQVEWLEQHAVFEFVVDPKSHTCVGVKAKNREGQVSIIYATHTILATGGVGSLYSFSSNAPTVTGDGIALAYRAGAELADLEFIQFHPTLLYVNGETKGLISEAVRGEGAILVDSLGNAIMERYLPDKDLSPRHIVAQAIYEARQQGRDVFLDIRSIQQFELKFPTITALCRANGISIQNGFIPVAPGSHFIMGGVLVDEFGRTSVDGLYAIGEVASTGVHGANRLASNSLLEGLHYGKKLASYLNSNVYRDNRLQLIQLGLAEGSHISMTYPTLKEIQHLMMTYAGIVRTEKGLRTARDWFKPFALMDVSSEYLQKLDWEQTQRYLMMVTAQLIVENAYLRTESRGGHYRADYPTEVAQWREIHITQTLNGTEMRKLYDESNQINSHA